MATLFGAPLSPFVRKVRVLLIEKQVDYELNPVFPGSSDPAFVALSPLGKVPAWQDDQVGLADSSAICGYLDRRYPTPPHYPSGAANYGRALWFEEYADTKLFEVFTASIFFERLIRPMQGGTTDQAKVQRALTEQVPAVCAYLESHIAGDYLLGAGFTVADVAVASQVVNLQYAGEKLDAARYPKLAALAARAHARDSFSACLADEQRFMERMRAAH